MERFRVIEAGEGIEGAILKKISDRGGVRAMCVSDSHPALLVISPKAVCRKLAIPDACRTVLLPGHVSSVLGELRAASAVSYGTSFRDSLTLSSRKGERLLVALQRELVTVDGHVVERQEFPVRVPLGEPALPALAVTGALLLLGVPPEELN